jgi:uncharacterized repeat protein (TIGR03847 family)
MSTSFELDEVGHFTAGAVGEPGARTFYLQVSGGAQVVSLKVEKQQVAALAEFLAGALADLPATEAEPVPTLLDLVEPAVAEWVVGSIGVAYDEGLDRFVIVAEELIVVDEDDESAADLEGAHARFRLTRDQVTAFIPHAEALVGSGRPPCPICGRPMNLDGHVCPRSNGHTRPS